jgi:hypothetical protein
MNMKALVLLEYSEDKAVEVTEKLKSEKSDDDSFWASVEAFKVK